MENQRHKTSNPARRKGGPAVRWWAGWFKRPHRSCSHGLEKRLRPGSSWIPTPAAMFGRHRAVRRRVAGMATRLRPIVWRGAGPGRYRWAERAASATTRRCTPTIFPLGTAQENIADKVRKGRVRNGWPEDRRSLPAQPPPDRTQIRSPSKGRSSVVGPARFLPASGPSGGQPGGELPFANAPSNDRLAAIADVDALPDSGLSEGLLRVESGHWRQRC
jgi:hypothetical protein